MEVITTHVNADFDAMGSMIAAKKLYPKRCWSFLVRRSGLCASFL